MKHLVIGGVRSGKSDFAEKLLENALNDDNQQAVYIATSLAWGEETKSRISKHQLNRDIRILTKELDYKQHLLSGYLTEFDNKNSIILIECLSTWVGWYLSKSEDLNLCIEQYEQVKTEFLTILESHQAQVIVVTGEVGCGLIGETPLMRCYADKLGELNQQVASLSERVTVVTAGIEQRIKG